MKTVKLLRDLTLSGDLVYHFFDLQRPVSRKGIASMWRRSSILWGLAVLAMTMSSCIFDPKKGTEPQKPPIPYYDLTEKEHVLLNLELSYNQKDPNGYNKILDDGFVFFLEPGDVGGNVPEQWGVEDERIQTRRLLRGGEGYVAASSIDLDVRLEDGIQWIAVVPLSAPDETWYTTTVFYEFTIVIGPDTYLAEPLAKGQYTVRNSGTDAAPKWQLVEWRDLGQGT